MKVGDHNPKRNLRVLQAFVEECHKRDLEWVKVSDIEDAVRKMEDTNGDR